MNDEPVSMLSLPRTDTQTKRRILGALAGGARSVGFLAHQSGANYATTQATLRVMFTEGYFRVVNVGDDEPDLRITTAQPGEPVLDLDIYAAILTAIRGGARTVHAIAARTGIPNTRQLKLAVYLTIRAATNYTRGQP